MRMLVVNSKINLNESNIRFIGTWDISLGVIGKDCRDHYMEHQARLPRTENLMKPIISSN